MSTTKKLGRGLDSLLSPQPTQDDDEMVYLDPEQIFPNQLQPRKGFDSAALAGLIKSIKEKGILQPIVVRKVDEGYEIIAGERRWRAARQLGLPKIAAVINNVSDDKMLELALIENLQREDLNPIEKAIAFRDLIKNHNLTQEEAAQRIGKDRSSIANIMRLLDLPEEVQEHVSRGTISMGHARALLSISETPKQVQLCDRIQKEGLSVRSLERITSDKSHSAKKKRKSAVKPPHLHDLEHQLQQRLGTKVEIEENKGKGKIIIEFYSEDDFQRVYESVLIMTLLDGIITKQEREFLAQKAKELDLSERQVSEIETKLRKQLALKQRT